MFDIQEATEKLQASVYGSKKIYWVLDYHSIYLFRIERFGVDPEEANYDPFFSVDKTSGEVKEFSMLTDGDPLEITYLVSKLPKEAK